MFHQNSVLRFDLDSVALIFKIGWQRAHSGIDLSYLQGACRRQFRDYTIMSVIGFFAIVFICHSLPMTWSPALQAGSPRWWAITSIASFSLVAYFWLISVVLSPEAKRLRSFIRAYRKAEAWLKKRGHRSTRSVDSFVFAQLKALEAAELRRDYSAGCRLWAEFSLRPPQFDIDLQEDDLSPLQRSFE